MRLLTLSTLFAALLFGSLPEVARAAPPPSGAGFPIDRGPITPYFLQPELRPEAVSAPLWPLRRDQIQPQIRVRNLGLTDAGTFYVSAYIWASRDGQRVRRRFRVRVPGLRAGASTVCLFPVINVDVPSRTRQIFVVDEAAPGTCGHVCEAIETNNQIWLRPRVR